MSDESLVVTVKEGRLRGKVALNYEGKPFYSFSGIPYAKAPSGDLRFKAPQPPVSWEGIKDATKEGPECPSRHMLFVYHVGAEDNCLNLNVYTKNLPQNAEGPPKPVMVWIHGGGFIFGSNKTEFFGPDYLMTEDIVLVTINYRLGILGFLCLEDPSLDVPGNAGLKDQVMALRWVKENIRQFNGDPDNVTIFGESAGAASVHYLYISPLAKGLFHKAIAQSGSVFNPWARGCPNAKIIAKYMGLKDTDEKKILQILKTASTDKLVKTQHKSPDAFISSTYRPFGPVIERKSPDAFLDTDPVEILRSGSFSKVPLIMGFTSKEGIFFEAVKTLQPEAGIPKDFQKEIHFDLNLEPNSEKSLKIADSIRKMYFQGENVTEKDMDDVYVLKSDTQFIHGIHRAIQLQKQHDGFPVYLYKMTLDTSINYYKRMSTAKSIHLLFAFYYFAYKAGDGFAKSMFMKLSRSVPSSSPSGVCHADDLGYIFKSFMSSKIEPGSIEDVSIKRFVRMWTNFARCGDPTPADDDLLPKNVGWKPVTKEQNFFLELGRELKVSVNPESDRMQFWDSVYGLNDGPSVHNLVKEIDSTSGPRIEIA